MSAAMRMRSPALPALLWRQAKRIGPLGTIILLHIVFFWALQSGLVRQGAQAMPKEIVATFISPEPQPKLQPAAPKTVPVVKKAVMPPKPAVPAVNHAPSEKAITVPPAAPAPAAALAQAEAPAPVVAAVPAAPALPRTVTAGIEYRQPPQPEYPPIARRLEEEGKTVLRVLVNEKGRPERVDVQMTSGSARLDEAARQAVLHAIFKPFIEDGKAVPAYAIVPIRFQLD